MGYVSTSSQAPYRLVEEIWVSRTQWSVNAGDFRWLLRKQPQSREEQRTQALQGEMEAGGAEGPAGSRAAAQSSQDEPQCWACPATPHRLPGTPQRPPFRVTAEDSRADRQRHRVWRDFSRRKRGCTRGRSSQRRRRHLSTSKPCGRRVTQETGKAGQRGHL